MTATPHLTSGAPDGAEAIGNVQSLERDFVNAAGQVVTKYEFFDLTGYTYSTSTTMPAEGVYSTEYAYNHRGLLDRVESPTGTITRTVYDGLGQVVSVWVGVNDTPATGWWSPTNPAGMTEIATYQYDNGGVGDGDLTQETLIPGGVAGDDGVPVELVCTSCALAARRHERSERNP
jgi:YD repeat-containing protein